MFPSQIKIVTILLLLLIPAIKIGSKTMQTEQISRIIIAKEKTALDRWGNGDPWGYIELGAPDVTYFAEGSDTLISGFEAFKAANAPLEGKIHIPRFEMIDPEVRVFGGIAILTFVLQNYDVEDHPTSRWMSTEIYRQMDGDWKLFHSHWTLVKK